VFVYLVGYGVGEWCGGYYVCLYILDECVFVIVEWVEWLAYWVE